MSSVRTANISTNTIICRIKSIILMHSLIPRSFSNLKAYLVYAPMPYKYYLFYLFIQIECPTIFQHLSADRKYSFPDPILHHLLKVTRVASSARLRPRSVRSLIVAVSTNRNTALTHFDKSEAVSVLV